MKHLEPLITSLYEAFSNYPSYVGQFTDSTTKTKTTAIAYGETTETTLIPTRDKCFIVYNLENAITLPSESKSRLREVYLKVYIGGFDAITLAELLTETLDGSIIASHTCTSTSMNHLPNGDVTLRFTLI